MSCRIIKHLFVLLSSFLIATYDSNAKVPNFGGAYLGGGIDRHSFNVRREKNINYGSSPFYGLVFLAGFGHQFENNLYLGLEGQINISGFTRNKGLGSEGGDVFYRPSRSGIIRLGYAMEKFMPYIIIGIERGEYKLPDNKFAGSSQSMYGVKKGLGLEYLLSENISLRGEFSVSNYRNRSLKTYSYTDQEYLNLNLEYRRFSLQNRTTRIAVTYKFQ